MVACVQTIQGVRSVGQQLVKAGHYATDTITDGLTSLEVKWTSLNEAAVARKDHLVEALKVQQVITLMDDMMYLRSEFIICLIL